MELSAELTVGAQQARAGLRDLIDEALEQNQPTIIHRSGRPVAVLVPYNWYLKQTEGTALND